MFCASHCLLEMHCFSRLIKSNKGVESYHLLVEIYSQRPSYFKKTEDLIWSIQFGDFNDHDLNHAETPTG